MIWRIGGGQHADGVLVVARLAERGPQPGVTIRVELAETGRLDLESMVTRRIELHDVNDALAAVERGEVIRSVICIH